MARSGVVYSETVVHLAAPAFAADAPYQVAIVQFADGAKLTARIVGERAVIGDAVVETEALPHSAAFQKA